MFVTIISHQLQPSKISFMHFYLLLTVLSAALVDGQKRHIYLGTKPLINPPHGTGTVEYLSADGFVNVVAHWAVLLSECGHHSPRWKPDSTKPVGTLFELFSDETGNNRAQITRHFRPAQMDGWTFKHIGTTFVTDEELRNEGSIHHIASLTF